MEIACLGQILTQAPQAQQSALTLYNSTFFLSIFTENEDGTYTRNDEVQTEKCYSFAQLEKALIDTGFEILGVYGDLCHSAPKETDEKWYFTVRCKKSEGSPNYSA